jgi:hypothetical protein
MSSKCDFCSAPDPPHMEGSPSFDLAPGATSLGDWASCDECHQLIAGRRWRELEHRAVEAMKQRYPNHSQAQIMLAVRHLQNRFRARRHEVP